jgi:hypothetical protein
MEGSNKGGAAVIPPWGPFWCAGMVAREDGGCGGLNVVGELGSSGFDFFSGGGGSGESKVSHWKSFDPVLLSRISYNIP